MKTPEKLNKKQEQELDTLRGKLSTISKILGEPLDVSIGIDVVDGKETMKILNIETKSGLKAIENPLRVLAQAIYRSSGAKVAKQKKEKLEYAG